MSIIQRLLGLGRKPTVDFVNKGVVATRDVVNKKVKVPVYDISKLLESPEIDRFVGNTAKQNATILSDNFVIFSSGLNPYRVITKRLPSGTTIAQAFDPTGNKAFKEVLSEKGSALSYGPNPWDGMVALVRDFKKSISIYKPMFSTASEKQILPADAKVADHFFDRVEGLTKFASSKG